MPRSKGRTGRPYRRARATVLNASTVCWICGKPGATTVDHIIPVSRMAPTDPRLTDPANLRPAHGPCNSRRGNRTRIKPKPPTSRNW